MKTLEGRAISATVSTKRAPVVTTMFTLLLVILCIHEATPHRPKAVCSNNPSDADVFRRTLLSTHNAARKHIVSKLGMVQRDGTHLPGSKNLFKMTYDCDLEGIAMTIVQDCPRKPDPRYVPSGKSVNYEVRRLVNDEPGSDVAYTNETKKKAIEPYANIIYHKTLAVGCMIHWCSSKKLATSCIYSGKPKLGEPLYDPGKKGTKCGEKSCGKVIKGATCIDAGQLKGLCQIDMKESTRETATTRSCHTKPVNADNINQNLKYNNNDDNIIDNEVKHKDAAKTNKINNDNHDITYENEYKINKNNHDITYYNDDEKL
ncbi:hypothetical protein Aduo_002330 [Ancylostoma duodenale]